jgi:hypothetical protein
MADNDGLGRGAAAWKSAAATVGARQRLLNLYDLRIHVNVKHSGGHGQSNTGQQTEPSNSQTRSEHTHISSSKYSKILKLRRFCCFWSLVLLQSDGVME